eukprot:2616261-Alexandrium_andersonii.AAC.1
MVALLSAQRVARTAVKPPNTTSTVMRQRSQEESKQNSMAQVHREKVLRSLRLTRRALRRHGDD